MKFISHAYRMGMFTFLIISIFASACSIQENNKSEVDKFPVVTPLLKDTTYTTAYIADIQAIQHTEIRSRVPAFVDRIHVSEGQQVKKGQLLFTLSSQEFKEEVFKATAILKSTIAEAKAAEVDLRSATKLVENNVVSEMELEIAKSKLEALRARIEEAKSHESSAKLRLSFAEIRAPFDGIVDRIPKKAGSLVSEGELLTFLSDPREVVAYFNLSEVEYLDYLGLKQANETSEARLELVNGSLHQHSGHVTTAEGQIDRHTGNIAFRAVFANPDFTLKHGSSGKVLIEKQLRNAILIPQKSTFEIQDKTYVFILDENNVARQTVINPKLRIPHFYILDAGLKSTDRIVYEGVQRIKDGDHISAEDIPSHLVLAEISNQ